MNEKKQSVFEEKLEKELTFRALFWGVIIGLLLLLLMIYLYAVVGMDINPAPIASMLGVFLIPIVGGKTNRKEINLMQTCVSATVFSGSVLPFIYVAAMFLGQEFSFVGTIIPILLANSIGICFVTFLRKQYVEDPMLSFPQSVMAKTAVDKVGQLTGGEAKILFIAAAIGFVISLLQNKGVIPVNVDISSHLPAGMTMGILLMPLMIGMGYLVGTRACLCLFATSLITNLIYAPIGTKAGWFADPAVDYSGMQNFNLSIVVGIALCGSLVPIIKQRKAFLSAFKFDTASMDDEEKPFLKKTFIIMICAIVLLTVFCSIYYHVNALLMVLFIVISIVFSVIAVRVVAESGLSACMPLTILMLAISFFITKNITVAMIISFIMVSIMLLAQNTMGDLKTGQMVGSDPKKLIVAQFVGVIPSAIVGTVFFYLFIKAYGMDSTFFSYPLGKMFYAIGEGLSSEGGAAAVFSFGRFAAGGVLGIALTFLGLPAGAIALAVYLAPSSIMSIALGGIIRFVIEKMKGKEFAEKYNNAATGVVIGDTFVTLYVVFSMLAMV